MKRFTNLGNKINEQVRYPPQLSLKPFMSSSIDGLSGSGPEQFDLYGVVVHQGGGCRSGHYFSYCKGFDGEWYDCNDDYVGKSTLDRVLRQQAYILFYQKRIVKEVKVDKQPEVSKKAEVDFKGTETIKKQEVKLSQIVKTQGEAKLEVKKPEADFKRPEVKLVPPTLPRLEVEVKQDQAEKPAKPVL